MQTLEVPYTVPVHWLHDSRGAMGMVSDEQLPFAIRRVFWLFDVPHQTLRGGHAHHSSRQLLVCTQGLIRAVLEGLQGKRYEFNLGVDSQGLYVPPLYWGTFRFSENATCLCLASDLFREDDYIRDFKEFQKMQHVYQSQ